MDDTEYVEQFVSELSELWALNPSKMSERDLTTSFQVEYIEQLRRVAENISSTPDLNRIEVYRILIKIFDVAVYRTIPSKKNPKHEIDFDDEDQGFELNFQSNAALQMFLEVLDSPLFRIDEAKKAFNVAFVNKLMNMFYTPDTTERDQLKTLLHRVYAKFLNLRAKIRTKMKYIFMDAIYSDEFCPGISQLLDLLSSIVNGFATPLKQEHKNYLKECLIPLLKLPNLSQYEAKLHTTFYNYACKDTELLFCILNAIISYWPRNVPLKQIVFIRLLQKELLDLLPTSYYHSIRVNLLYRLNRSLHGECTAVTEHAVSFITTSNAIMKLIASDPTKSIMILLKNRQNVGPSDWNSHVIFMFQELDQRLSEKFYSNYIEALDLLKNDPSQTDGVQAWQSTVNKIRNTDMNDSTLANNTR